MSAVEQSIRARKTSKVLLPVKLRHEQEATWQPEHDEILRSMLEAAAWAPFHKRAHESHGTSALNAPMPWRFYVLGPSACTALLAYLEKQAEGSPDPKWARAWKSKITEMISACGVLVQATWLPDPAEPENGGSSDDAPDFTDKNIEHVAAASSAVQSLLLAAQSHQWLSYWSSGGILRDAEVFDYMNINRDEKLLGSLFLTPKAHSESRVIDGGLREQRGELEGWVAWV